MAEEVTEELNEDVEGERPSTIKAGFQRWLIVAGILVTMLFVYLFMVMSANEKEKEEQAAPAETIPEQVQDGSSSNQNSAIARFNRGINTDRSTSDVGNKMEDSGINKDFAPRKTASYESSEKNANERRQEKQKQQKKLMPEQKTPYQKYLEAEQMRAYQSIASEDSIGSSNGFYDDKSTSSGDGDKTPISTPNKQSIAERQAALKKKIEAITQYRKDLQSGKADAASPPPELAKMLGGD